MARTWLAEEGSIGQALRERPAGFIASTKEMSFFFQMNPKPNPPHRTVMKPSIVRLRPPWLWKKRSQPERAQKQTWRLKVRVDT